MIVAAGIAFAMVSNRQSKNRTIASMETGSCKYDEKADRDAGAGRNHVSSPAYGVNPPSGGNHDPSPAAAGIYTAQDAPPDVRLVHSLEHGYVILWHRPESGDATAQQLDTLASKYGKDVLVVPRESLPTPVAATAWHRRLLCQSPEPEALEKFIKNFRNEGPEQVPH